MRIFDTAHFYGAGHANSLLAEAFAGNRDEVVGVTPQQVGMAWLLEHSPNTAVISGTSNPDHLRENLSAGRISLDAEAMRRLDARHIAGD